MADPTAVRFHSPPPKTKGSPTELTIVAQSEGREVEMMHLKYIELLEKRISQLEGLVTKPVAATAPGPGSPEEKGKAKADASTKVCRLHE